MKERNYERNFEKLLLTNLVIHFQFLLLKWQIYLYISKIVRKHWNIL